MKKVKTYPAREAKNKFGEVFDEAQRQPVTITRNGRPIGAVVNMQVLNKVMEMERKSAQLEILRTLGQLQDEVKESPKPTRAQLRELLECDDEELDALIDGTDLSNNLNSTSKCNSSKKGKQG
ncbi:MAG: type II toxin-antitoxin system prevent-host-death family antitoxin [Gammaproteobacteria bacterium]|nr:type II toxin-antitoxin system prevent-host-death family antitoxin [Gammaproteobacteria bacterium]